MSSLRASLLLVLALLLGTRLHAQENGLKPRQTAEFWLSSTVLLKPLGTGFDSKALKRTRLSGELGYRGQENLTDSKLLYGVLGVRYKFSKHFRAMLENRYSLRGPTSTNSFRNDLQFDATTSFGRFGLGYRMTLQHEYADVTTYRDIFRNRIGIELNTKKFPIDPYVAAESFTALHYTGNMLIGMRYTIGANWNLGDGRSLDLGLRHDREINLYDPLYRWIIAASFDVNLDP